MVYLGTQTTDEVANVIVAQMLYLDSETSSQPISLYLIPPRGSYWARPPAQSPSRDRP